MSGAKVAVLGGDRRELVIARCFAADGWEVACFGTPQEPASADLEVASLEAALTGASVVVTPAPGMAGDGSLYAPASPAPIVLDVARLGLAAPGAQLFAGNIHPLVAEAAAEAGVSAHAFADDDRLQVLHAIPTAEGAIARTVDHFEDTINGQAALVVGYGRIGVILSAYLRALGATTTVSARRPESRARALAAGHRTVDTDPASLRAAALEARLLYTTAPAHLLPPELLAELPPTALLMDLASPPGGFDHDVAAEVAVPVVWARGQAGTAPVHSGEAQYELMRDQLAGLGIPHGTGG